MEMLELAAELKWCRERIALYEVEREQMQIYYRRAITERDKLRSALTRLRDCDWTITLPDRMDAVRAIARAALEDGKP